MSCERLWQDKEVRFDAQRSVLLLRGGENSIDSINSVEDTKGNSGETGSLIVSNLRIMWASHKSRRTNLSIGLNTVISISIQKARLKLHHELAQALHIVSKFNGSHFEFIFTSYVQSSPRLFTTVQAVLRAYETSRLYRELKLRITMFRGCKLSLLRYETLHSCIRGAWNLSSEQGNLGVLFLTNMRVLWHASIAANFNVSVPYIETKDVKIRASKFGRVLVIFTFHQCGHCVLGFRIGPNERLVACLQEINSLRAAFAVKPQFGVFRKCDSKQLATPRHLRSCSQELPTPDANVAARPHVPRAVYNCVASCEVPEIPPTFNWDLGLASDFSLPISL
eukprot:CAMPEP_0198650232 /NCGR_PEP_ID=MMETSP1467-20131203/4830_1 /TAXON_ID=1462469 /ORGANISM="unid. sp., Strain CCMP2135" /LENGTH=336 /DNA_ID=CAMNT_0044386073 /DNA_START=102 /DNA_END=1112 /DNA_ORIENTATION=+